jgi:hypothetical protein
MDSEGTWVLQYEQSRRQKVSPVEKRNLSLSSGIIRQVILGPDFM